MGCVLARLCTMRPLLLLTCLLFTPTLARAQPIASETARAELELADQWLDVSARELRVEQNVARWFMPISLGVLAVGGTAAMLAGPDDRTATLVGGGLSSAALLGMTVPTVLARPGLRRQLGATGAALGALGWGSTLLIASRTPRTCDDQECIQPRSERFFAGSLMTLGVGMLTVWLVPAPPSLDDVLAAQALPEAERVRATERLLARIDRARRTAGLALLVSYLASSAVLAVGAATAERAHDRQLLASFSVIAGSQALLSALFGLFPPRLERFITGHAPRRRGW